MSGIHQMPWVAPLALSPCCRVAYPSVLLMHFDTFPFIDTMGNPITTEAATGYPDFLPLGKYTVQDTVIKKFGVSSANITSGGYSGVSIQTASASLAIPADFTVEAWVYLSSTAGTHNVADIITTDSWGLYCLEQGYEGAWKIDFSHSGTDYYSTTTIPRTTWKHIAVTRCGTILKMFINGVLVNTFTDNHSDATATTAYMAYGNLGYINSRSITLATWKS